MGLMGFISKKLPYKMLKTICKLKFFKRISHFLRICILSFKKILCYVRYT
jgi:hypothetical protein